LSNNDASILEAIWNTKMLVHGETEMERLVGVKVARMLRAEAS
jgi:hypothetical protein